MHARTRACTHALTKKDTCQTITTDAVAFDYFFHFIDTYET